jgi:hypothetical protein
MKEYVESSEMILLPLPASPNYRGGAIMGNDFLIFKSSPYI